MELDRRIVDTNFTRLIKDVYMNLCIPSTVFR